MSDILELVAATAYGAPAAAMAVFLILLVLILRVTKGLIGACVFIALFGSVLTTIWLLAWPGSSTLASMNGWTKLISLMSLTTFAPLLVAAIPILLVARAQMNLIVKIGICVIGVVAAVIVFPVVGLWAGCALGDCL